MKSRTIQIFHTANIKRINNINVEVNLNKIESLKTEKEEKKTLLKSFRFARKNKSPFFIIQNKKEISVAVRFKKRYKYLDLNEVAQLVVQHNSNIKNIVDGVKTSPIVFKLFKKNNNAKNTLDLSENLRIFDAENNDVTLSEIVNTFSDIYSRELNPYTEIMKSWKLFGIYRYKEFNKKTSPRIASSFIKRTLKSKHKNIAGKDVDQIVEISKNTIKILFKDESFIVFEANKSSIKTFSLTHGDLKIPLEKLILFEGSIKSGVEDNTEEFLNKKFSGKGFIKYTIFFLLIVLTFYLVFSLIYQSSPKESLYSLSTILVHKSTRIIGFSVFGGSFVNRIIGSGRLKRMLMIQNEKVKLRNLFVANLMSTVISFITPFAVGGDAIGYGYLRRKGFKRGPLAATFISDTLLFQAKFTIQTVILVGFGGPIYREIFMANDPHAQSALFLFIIGTSGTIFATFMIFTLVLGKSFQEGIIKTAIKLLEGSRFANIVDPIGMLAKYQYEFAEMRSGMKKVGVHWFYPVELFFYTMLTLFIQPWLLVLFFNGTISESIAGVNGYIGAIVINDIIGTANSLSITPGGAGTGEYLTIATTKFLYTDIKGVGSRDIASSIDFAYKMLIGGPGLLFSAVAIPSVILLENRRSAIKILNKNSRLNNQKHVHTTSMKKYILFTGGIIISGYAVYFALIFSR